MNLPYPSTLLLNRFYTAEFFAMVRELLTENGIVVTAMPASLSYLSDEQRNLNAMAYFRDFSRGVLDTRGVVFFVTTAALFLFLSVKALESRRWR